MLSLSTIKTHIYVKNKVLSLKSLLKRVSFPSSFHLKLKGSMAVEGSLVLPIFLFYMVTILYSLEMVRFQSDVFEAMHQAIGKAGILAYMGSGSGDQETTIPEISVNTEVQRYLEEQSHPYLCVKGGMSGVSGREIRNYLGAGNIGIKVSYQMKPLIGWLSIGKLYVEDHCLVHGFVGYLGDGSGEALPEKEIYVYITPTGTKYHMSENCTYLQVQIQAVQAAELATLRNASGEIYRACETCRPQESGLLYLTQWGNRYHGRSDCSALKRTIYIVPISQVGVRGACKKCG